MATLWCIGDSWSAGWAGDDLYYDHSMANQMADILGYDTVKNYSLAAASIGMITDIYLNEVLPKMEPGDLLFACAPPDSRFHRTMIDQESRMIASSLNNSNEDAEYLAALLKYNSLDFFRWHYSIFCKLIRDSATVKGVECYIQHNYGQLPDIYEWLDRDMFLDYNKSMWDWMELPPADIFVDWCDGPRDCHLTQAGDIYSDETYKVAKEKLIINKEGIIDIHPNQQYQNMIGERLADLVLLKRARKK